MTHPLSYSIFLPDIDVRLVIDDEETNGADGLVQVYVNGHWGAICGDDFGDLEADAVCYNVGFDKASEVHHSATELYNSWPDRVFLENFDCFKCDYYYGGCYSMSDCDYESLEDYSCLSYDYVGVECDDGGSSDCK